jgi:biopolymer transport protein ExbB
MEILKNVIDFGIMGLLIFMSLASAAIVFERILFYRKMDLKSYTDKTLLELDLTSKLYLLAAIGANAPYIGLLGTVLGIILTFHTIGASGMMDSGQIMIALALTMKVTAAGLIVAIPSLFVYNILIRKVREMMARWQVQNAQPR